MNRLDNTESQNARVFVGNVAPGTDQDLLLEHFKKHGNISGVVVLKGFGFVQFEKEEDAQKAILAENGSEFMGRKIDVKVAIQKPKEDKPKEEPYHAPPPQQQPPQQQQYNDNANYHNDNSYRGGGGNRGGQMADRGMRGGGRGTRRGNPNPYNRNERPPYYGGGGQDDGWSQSTQYGGGYQENYPPPQHGNFRGNAPHVPPPEPEVKNDCEIVCMSKGQRQYAEMIESRLKNLGLRIDVLFPNPDIPLVKILENISSRGILFAIVVNALNEQHRSLTLNVLQGQQQEHRNMPLEDAMVFMAKNFEATVEGKTPAVVGADVVPEDIRIVLGFLADNRPLSVMEYDKLIRYFAMRREGVLKMEYGENIPPSLATPPVGPPIDPAIKAKQDELHERIISILNRPAPPPVDSTKMSTAYSATGAGPGSSVSITPELNASLQRAIDSLIKTGPNLLSQIQNQGSTTGSQNSNSQPSQQQQGGGNGGGGYLFSAYGGRDSY